MLRVSVRFTLERVEEDPAQEFIACDSDGYPQPPIVHLESLGVRPVDLAALGDSQTVVLILQF